MFCHYSDHALVNLIYSKSRTKMNIFNPPHPGLTLKEDVFPALGLTLIEASEKLKIPYDDLYKITEGKLAITNQYAARIEDWLGRENGGSAGVWLAQQAAYDKWHANNAK